jgi:hypothetical protein
MTQQTKGNDPISATQEYHSKNFGVVLAKTGLTKREYFAAMAMQGICGNSSLAEISSYNSFAEWSVQQADALIEALNKEK